VEDDFPDDVIAALKAMGYPVNKKGAIGRTELIRISEKPVRTITAIADKRGDDAAGGY
jgi:gamma-glutamyltranspeptidase/glutathione hydrolase